MKRILVWVLILQFASGHNLLAELARMPMLAEHFKTHQQETPDLSFARFLWLHYGETSHSHGDNSHAKLPLHCAHGTVAADSVLPQPPEISQPNWLAEAVSRQKMPVADEFLRLSAPASGLFRPPIAA